MSTLLQDLRYGLRTLVRSPGFTATAVLTLALGIGANTAVFSVVNTVFLRPFPFPEAGRLVFLSEKVPQPSEMPVSYPNFLDWQAQNQAFENIAVFQNESLKLVGAGAPESIASMNVSVSFFPTLQVKPILGRNFLPSEDSPGGNSAVIMSHSLWQSHFGADPGLIGKALTLKGTLGTRSFTVVGILPPRFGFFGQTDVLFVPIGLWRNDGYLMKRENHDRTLAVARMKPGVSLEQARSQMETIARRLEQQYPKSNTGVGVSVTPLRERLVRSTRPSVLLLLCSVAFVLLIACVNVANLLLARSLARQREVAIRVALGAGRRRVIRQLLTESLLLGLTGGALGLLLGVWSSAGLAHLIPQDLPEAGISIDHRVLAFTLVISLLTGVAFGLAPALQASRPNLNETLKEGGRTPAASLAQHRLRNLLVVSEFALALVLLVGAGLMIRSFQRVLAVDPGFNPQNVLTVQLDLADPKYADDPARFSAFNRQLIERVRALPGVQFAGTVRPLPLSGGRSDLPFYREDGPVPAAGEFPVAGWHAVSPGYFQAMGIPLLKGRFIADSDDAKAPPVATINRAMARHIWLDEDPVGKRFRFGTPEMGGPWVSVVGVVGNTKPLGLEAATQDEFYISCLQLGTWVDMSLVVRTASDPLRLAATVREQVLALDKEMAVSDVITMEQRLAQSLAGRRTNMLLLGAFATLAMVLASVGIYGVMSYSATQRLHEIGVRIALGAKRRDVLKLLVGQGLLLALAGVGLGLAGALALTRFLASLLYGVHPTDPVTFAGVSLLLTGVALLATYIPARRATKVDPMVALRYE